MSEPAITIAEAMEDANLLGAGFGKPETWKAWRTVLKAAFGLGVNGADELELFKAVAGDRDLPSRRVRELWCVAGRRAGKSRVAAAIAVYLAAILDHRHLLSPGEVGYVMIIAASMKQARVIADYCEGFLKASPILASMLAERTAEELRLSNGVIISVHTNSYRTIRGRTLLACLFDETSFWRDETSASPDTEVYKAVLPSLSTTKGMLVAISSAYRQAGLLYQKHRQYFGVSDPDTLVLKAETRQLNPTIDQAIIDRALAEDPEGAAAEWLSEFRGDLSTFLFESEIRLCVEAGVRERRPVREWDYYGFVDAAGGTGRDSMCLAITHTEGQTRVLDLVLERHPPFSPEAVAAEYCDILKQYRVKEVVGDKYAGDWPAEQFRKGGVNFKHSERTKSQIYLNFQPMVRSRAVDLLDDQRLISQLAGLERRATGSGRDSVDHAKGAHDDLANVAAGALCLAPAEAKIRMMMRLPHSNRNLDPLGADPLNGF